MSSFSAQARAVKTRAYKQRRRAETREQTRRRIVEAAVDLHSSVGPLRTTVSQIAERAGVQRHTYYAHFPDERSLFLACSALALENGPLPDLEPLKLIGPGAERVRTGLSVFYNWFERNQHHAACVLRDAETHPLTREMVELRMAPVFRKAGEILGEGLSARSRALLLLALDFYCWRNLSETHDVRGASALMADAIAGLD